MYDHGFLPDGGFIILKLEEKLLTATEAASSSQIAPSGDEEAKSLSSNLAAAGRGAHAHIYRVYSYKGTITAAHSGTLTYAHSHLSFHVHLQSGQCPHLSTHTPEIPAWYMTFTGNWLHLLLSPGHSGVLSQSGVQMLGLRL